MNDCPSCWNTGLTTEGGEWPWVFAQNMPPEGTRAVLETARAVPCAKCPRGAQHVSAGHTESWSDNVGSGWTGWLR